MVIQQVSVINAMELCILSDKNGNFYAYFTIIKNATITSKKRAVVKIQPRYLCLLVPNLHITHPQTGISSLNKLLVCQILLLETRKIF